MTPYRRIGEKLIRSVDSFAIALGIALQAEIILFRRKYT